MIGAMGSFRDPTIERDAMSLLLSNEFDIRQALGLFAGLGSAETHDVAYDFVKQNWDVLMTKLPTEIAGFVPFVAAGYCDAGHRADAEAFFKDRAAKYPGGPRNLAQVLEGIDLCIANKTANEAGVVEFLKKY